MIVCVCHNLNEKAVREAIERGCRSVAALARTTGAGSSCGQCVCDLRELVSEAPCPESAVQQMSAVAMAAK